jgi:hypothetical protein
MKTRYLQIAILVSASLIAFGVLLGAFAAPAEARGVKPCGNWLYSDNCYYSYTYTPHSPDCNNGPKWTFHFGTIDHYQYGILVRDIGAYMYNCTGQIQWPVCPSSTC